MNLFRSSWTAPATAVGLMLTVGCLTMGNTTGTPTDDGAESDPDALATFDVTVKKEHANCGGGQLAIDDGWTFEATLTRDEDGEHIYWDAGKGPKEGSLDEQGLVFAITSTLEIDMRTPEDSSWLPPCRIRRVDALGGELDHATNPTAFAGSMSFHFEATDGSDCSDLLVGPERLLQQLPCDAVFTVTATARPDEGGGGQGGGAQGGGGQGGEGGQGGDGGSTD